MYGILVVIGVICMALATASVSTNGVVQLHDVVGFVFGLVLIVWGHTEIEKKKRMCVNATDKELEKKEADLQVWVTEHEHGEKE